MAAPGGAAIGPPLAPPFGGASAAGGGAPAMAGFAAFGGMFVARSVPLPAPGPIALEGCVYFVKCGDTACECSYECPGDTPFASCFEDTERVPDGSWSCTFSASGRAETYRVGGVDVAEACHIVADLAGGEPEQAGAESCASDFQVSSDTSCEYAYRCTRPIVSARGQMASLGTARHIGCSEHADVCLVGDVAYQADEIEVADRCSALVPYVEEPPDPVFEEPPECATTVTEEIAGGCQTHTLCSRIAEIGPSVSVVNQQLVYTACESDGYGSSRCACADDDHALRFDTPWPTNDATACEVAQSACQGGFEFSGEASCRQRYVSVDGAHCEAMEDCKRPASLAGSEVIAIGTLQASCAHDGDAYACRCLSGDQAIRLEVGAPPSFDGCVQASEACRDALELRFFGDNGSVGAPSP